MKLRNASLLLVSPIFLLTACSTQDGSLEHEEKREEEINELSPGIVEFNEDDILIELDLKGEDRDLFAGDPINAGPVMNMLLSPNEKFLAIETGQGGGVAVMIYDIEEEKVHALGSFAAKLEWLEDNRLRMEDYVRFGENIGDLDAVYESLSNERPWEIEKIDQ